MYLVEIKTLNDFITYSKKALCFLTKTSDGLLLLDFIMGKDPFDNKEWYLQKPFCWECGGSYDQEDLFKHGKVKNEMFAIMSKGK